MLLFLTVLAIAVVAALGGLVWAARWYVASNESDEASEDTLWFDPREWIVATRLFKPKALRLPPPSAETEAAPPAEGSRADGEKPIHQGSTMSGRI